MKKKADSKKADGTVWLRTGAVAKIFDVDPRTVARWASREGGLPHFKTPGGQYKFNEKIIKDLINKGWQPPVDDDVSEVTTCEACGAKKVVASV